MSDELKNSYLHNVMVSVDQFGNTLFGGNPDSTISARTGYFSARTGERFWILQERLINYAFKPVDGPNHCREAWQADANEVFYVAGPVAKAAMAATVCVMCFVIGTALRIYKALI